MGVGAAKLVDSRGSGSVAEVGRQQGSGGDAASRSAQQMGSVQEPTAHCSVDWAWEVSRG